MWSYKKNQYSSKAREFQTSIESLSKNRKSFSTDVFLSSLGRRFYAHLEPLSNEDVLRLVTSLKITSLKDLKEKEQILKKVKEIIGECEQNIQGINNAQAIVNEIIANLDHVNCRDEYTQLLFDATTLLIALINGLNKKVLQCSKLDEIAKFNKYFKESHCKEKIERISRLKTGYFASLHSKSEKYKNSAATKTLKKENSTFSFLSFGKSFVATLTRTEFTHQISDEQHEIVLKFNHDINNCKNISELLEVQRKLRNKFTIEKVYNDIQRNIFKKALAFFEDETSSSKINQFQINSISDFNQLFLNNGSNNQELIRKFLVLRVKLEISTTINHDYKALEVIYRDYKEHKRSTNSDQSFLFTLNSKEYEVEKILSSKIAEWQCLLPMDIPNWASNLLKEDNATPTPMLSYYQERL